jgi:predicted MFS family arabinose efflux permease
MLIMFLAGASHAIATAALGLWGFSFGSYPVSAQTFLASAAPDYPESASALQTATFTTAISLGAIAGGVLVNTSGPASVIVWAGCATMLGTLLVRAIKT